METIRLIDTVFKNDKSVVKFHTDWSHLFKTKKAFTDAIFYCEFLLWWILLILLLLSAIVVDFCHVRLLRWCLYPLLLVKLNLTSVAISEIHDLWISVKTGKLETLKTRNCNKIKFIRKNIVLGRIILLKEVTFPLNEDSKSTSGLGQSRRLIFSGWRKSGRFPFWPGCHVFPFEETVLALSLYEQLWSSSSSSSSAAAALMDILLIGIPLCPDTLVLWRFLMILKSKISILTHFK